MHKINLIVAVDNNWAIGKNNDLLYHIPEDMKFFKEKTENNIIIIGYNTLLSFPNSKPLNNRLNLVLTRKNINETENMKIVHSIDDLLSVLNSIKDDREVFVCGGASIYKQLLPYCDYAYVTKIDANTENATHFMVNLDKLENWHLSKSSICITDEKSQKNICFCKYEKDGAG